MISNIPSPGPLGALVLPSPISTARSAHATTSFGEVRVLFVVGVILWTVCASAVAVALVLGLDACATLPMASAGRSIGIVFGVLVPLRTTSYLGFPIKTVADSVSTILNGRAPVEIIQKVVITIIVFMAAVHSRCRAGTAKSLEHQHMNSHLLGLTVPVQSARTVPIADNSTSPYLSQYAASEDSESAPSTLPFSIQRSDSAPVGNLIVGVIRRRKPSFLTGHKDSITLSSTQKKEAMTCP